MSGKMMTGATRALLAATRLRVAEERLVLVRLSVGAYSALWEQLDRVGPHAFLSLTVSPEETTVLVSQTVWKRMARDWSGAAVEPGWRLITLEQTISLDVAGYLAPLAQALAAEGIPLLVVSAFSTDHLLVREEHLERALEALQRVIDKAAGELPPGEVHS
ncbi:MAG: ACT domain-containing protein [Anaerolineae bacterium]|nr:ACT domain-containing protein [Anaerolineae bacterium]